MSSDEEYITHDKGTLSAVGKMVVVKIGIVFSNGVLIHNHGPGTFKIHNCGGKISMEEMISNLF